MPDSSDEQSLDSHDDGAADIQPRVLRRRAKAVKTTRSKNIFIPGWIDGKWSKYEHWLRCVLQLYISYEEVVKPKRADDGSVKLDSFGRTAAADTAEERALQHKVKKGAVWFTRETLREGWSIALLQLAYRHEPKLARIYEGREAKMQPVLEPGRVTPRFKKSTAHPMDQVVANMVKDGRLIRASGNHYMLSKDTCERLEMPEAWDIHLARGQRWEGLFYTSRQVPWDQVMVHRRAVLDDRAGTHATIWMPHSTLKGKRHPNEPMWDSIYAGLAEFLMFDRATLAEVAMNEVALGLTDPADPRIDTHLARWHDTGKIIKVLPRLYRSKQFEAFDRNRENFERPQRRRTGDWMIEWLMYWAPLQAATPDGVESYFTNKSIREFYETEADEAWVSEYLPDGLLKLTITSRLANYKKRGFLENTAHERRYRIAPELMRLLSPLWQKPDPWEAEAVLALREMRIIDASFAEALEMLLPDSPGRHIARVIDKAMKMPSDGEQTNAIFKICTKVKQSPGRISTLYSAEKSAWEDGN
jgi:hypothetical protein